MNAGGETADQVVKMSLEGIQVAANIAMKLGGGATKSLAAMLYAMLTDKKRTKGKTRLRTLLKSGKELKVFALRYGDLETFVKEAKRYGILYNVVSEKNNTDGIVDIMVRAEDASKISRLVDKFELATVNVDELNESIKANEGKTPEKFQNVPVMDDKQHEELVNSLFDQNSDINHTNEELPPSTRMGRESLSERESNGNGVESTFKKESVNKKLERIHENRENQFAERMKARGKIDTPELPIKKSKKQKEK